MGFNFPNSPSIGQLYPSPAVPGAPVWRWDGAVWKSATPGLGGIYIQDTPPAGAPEGSLWWESDTGLLFIRYNDGDSTQWVMAMPVADATQFAVRFDAAQSLTATQKAQARANIDCLKKNYIINGAMMVSQENGAAAGAVSGYFAADQFQNSMSHSGVVSIAQVASVTPAGSPNRIRYTVTTPDASVAAGDYLVVFQAIEGTRFADLRFGSAAAKTITVQFGVRAPAGTYSLVVRNGAATYAYAAEYTISAGEANTDVVKSITFPGAPAGTWLTDTGIGCLVSWGLMVGTTWQAAAGGWAATNNTLGTPGQSNFMATNGNVFELFDVGLYEGSAAPAFQVPDYVSELALCKRYYQKWINFIVETNTLSMLWPYPVEMRASPTIAGGGAGFTVQTSSAFGMHAYQTTRGYQTLLLNARL